MFQETQYQIGVPCIRVSGLSPPYLVHGAFGAGFRLLGPFFFFSAWVEVFVS